MTTTESTVSAGGAKVKQESTQSVYDELASKLDEFREFTEEIEMHDMNGETTSKEYVEQDRAEVAVEIVGLLEKLDERLRRREPSPRQWLESRVRLAVRRWASQSR